MVETMHLGQSQSRDQSAWKRVATWKPPVHELGGLVSQRSLRIATRGLRQWEYAPICLASCSPAIRRVGSMSRFVLRWLATRHSSSGRATRKVPSVLCG